MQLSLWILTSFPVLVTTSVHSDAKALCVSYLFRVATIWCKNTSLSLWNYAKMAMMLECCKELLGKQLSVVGELLFLCCVL
jgi:hypothetical protein